MRTPFKNQEPAGSFLPRDYVKGKNDFRANLLCLGLFAVVMTGVIGAFFVTNRARIQIKREQEIITADYVKEQAKIEALASLDEQNEELLAKADVTTALIEQIPRSVLLSELAHARRPENIALLEIRLEGKRQRNQQTVAGGANVNARTNNLSGRPAGQVAAKAAPVKAKAPAGKAKAGSAKAPARKPTPPRVEPPRFDYTIRIIGVAQVNSEITDYLRKLQESPILDNVDLKFIEGTEIDKDPFRKFEITATFKPGADGRTLLATNQPTNQPANQPATVPTPASAAAPTTTGPVSDATTDGKGE